MPVQELHIAVGVVRDEGGRILVSERKENCAYAGQWEFPGGKVESGESVQEALARELHEELGLIISAQRPLISIRHQYPDRQVLLDTWEATAWSGQAESREGQRFDWLPPDAPDDLPMLAANQPIVRAVQLPEEYLLTPTCGDDLAAFLACLEHSLQSGVRLVRLRQPALPIAQYEALALKCKQLCETYTAVLLLDRLEMARKYGLGLHLTGHELARCEGRPVGQDVLLAASCHDEVEIKKAAAIACDFAVLGPVAETRSHKGGRSMGWPTFARLAGLAVLPVYALGGMTRRDIAVAWQSGGQGIAAIRSLWPAD